MIEGYVQKKDRKKILFMCDDIRMTSGISTMAREIVVNTAHVFNWVNVGGAINHPDQGKRLDICDDTNNLLGIPDSSVYIYPISGYGTQELVRQLIDIEKPDAIMIFTDPRYWTWLFQMENEIRKTTPIIYLNIWDDLPAPLYNKPYYESCDTLFSISKQTKIINEMVLGESIKEKILKYVPHGINEKHFYPINEFMPEQYANVQNLKKRLFAEKEYDFVLFYNARNIRRKCVSDLIAAWSHFCDSISKEDAAKCALLLHTQAVDENGTDLPAVIDLLCSDDHKNVFINEERLATADLNLLYNCVDSVALISSNEGWGLSLTEAMMCGKPIIATVTGGMQDQMRFEDEDGNWFTPTKEMPSNHFGTYENHGKWAFPVFPSNMSLVGSVQTPYIWDDRADFRDIADQIQEVYAIKTDKVAEYGSFSRLDSYEEICKAARDWVTSDESMMSARWMAKNIIDGINETFDNFKPRPSFEFIKIKALESKTIPHPLTY
jgi:glycosyltransferase involved in cell wall biosynthesis